MEVISSNKMENNAFEAEFKVNGEEFEKAVQTAFLKKRNNITIPGFRKGKAPRKMIEKQYGENFFYEDAVNGMYQKAVADVIGELKIDVVDIPNIEVLSVGKDEGVSFKVLFTVKPEVNITGYLGLEVTETDKTVTDEAIGERLKQLQEKSARIVDITGRAAETGDTVIFDFKGSSDGVYFEGGSAEDFNLELGSGRFIPGFEEQIIGKNIDEEFNVNVTFPEDYSAAELAGKEAVFECIIHEIKGKELAELDDEFAKDVSEFDTLDELKQDLKLKISEELERKAKEDFDNEISMSLINKLEADIPPVMIESRIDDLMRDWEFRNRSQGLTVKDYIKYANITEEQFRDVFRPAAENHVKLRLALEKIAELENIEISGEKLEEEYKILAEMHKMDIDKVKKVINAEELKKDLCTDRALEIIKDNAKIKKAKGKKKKEEKE